MDPTSFEEEFKEFFKKKKKDLNNAWLRSRVKHIYARNLIVYICIYVNQGRDFRKQSFRTSKIFWIRF